MKIKLPIMLSLTLVFQVYAGSATWNTNPVDNNWTNPANWTPATVPNSLTDVATFGATAQPNITIPSDVTVAEVVFNPGASAYTFTVGPSSLITDFTIAGAGVTNNSAITQHINTPSFTLGQSARIDFAEAATAGDNVAYEVKSGSMFFLEHSSLGNAMVTVDGGSISGFGSNLYFEDTSTAATGMIALNGAISNGGFGGSVTFENNANLANAHLVAYGGIGDQHGATAHFTAASQSEAATIEVYGNAIIDLAFHKVGAHPLTIGSLFGDGIISGGSQLGVGKNDLDSAFFGLWAAGACVKIGRGTLTWSHPPVSENMVYIVRQGSLLFTDPDGTGSGGSGTVSVLGGSLGGNGTLTGPSGIGDGIGSGDARLAPGLTKKDSAVLTITGILHFLADSVYNCSFDFRRSEADQVVANGVTIDSAAAFSLIPVSMGTIPVGTAFTAIDNTATTKIGGTFSNLPDGAIVNVNGNNLQASYSGGDGNDLTLTVAP